MSTTDKLVLAAGIMVFKVAAFSLAVWWGATIVKSVMGW